MKWPGRGDGFATEPGLTALALTLTLCLLGSTARAGSQEDCTALRKDVFVNYSYNRGVYAYKMEWLGRGDGLATASRLTALALCLLVNAARAGNQEDFNALLKDVFANYSIDVRPASDSDNATDVYLGLHLMSIIEVNEQAQTMKTSTFLEIQWYDQYLTWETIDNAGIDSILMRQKMLWLPDIVVGNTVSTQKELGYDNLKIRIDYDGEVMWKPAGVFETTCDIDITYYPLDTQVCEINIQTAMSFQEEIQVNIDRKNPVDTSNFSANGLWDLLDISAENVASEVSNASTSIKFKLQLQRRRSYYILNIVLPIVLLSLTAPLTFALPSDAGEKMGLSITVLLAFAVYLTLVTDAMPSTSVQVSVLMVWLVILLAVTASSVILAVVILRFHHASAPVTGRTATVVRALRALLFTESQQRPEREEDEEGREEDEEVVNGAEQSLPPDAADRNKRGTATRRSNNNNSNAISPTGNPRSGNEKGSRSSSRLGGGASLTCAAKVKAVMSGPLVAETLDRFFLLVVTTVSLGSGFLCVLVLIVGSVRQEEATRLNLRSL